jgi:DNA phosphorothioation-dependent restriction protein DptG
MKESEFECPITNKIYQIKIGQNAQDNWDIIMSSDKSDIWFHVSNNPSCHVILASDNENLKMIPKSVLHHCASLCKDGSKQKDCRSVSIIYTEIKNVLIDKKGRIGSVFTKNTKTIKI